MQLFFLYKQMYDIRKKYFDFAANKQMAWFILTQSFLFMWLYKSYFMQWSAHSKSIIKLHRNQYQQKIF